MAVDSESAHDHASDCCAGRGISKGEKFMKKRILSGLLVAAMLLTSLPTAAFAADDTNAEAPDTGETQTILPQSEGGVRSSRLSPRQAMKYLLQLNSAPR